MPLWLIIILAIVLAVIALLVGISIGSRRTRSEAPAREFAVQARKLAVPVHELPLDAAAADDRSVAAKLVEVMHPAAVVIDAGDRVAVANEAARTMGVVRNGRLVVRNLLEMSREVRRNGSMTRDVELPALGRASTPLTLGIEAVALDREGMVGLMLHDVTEARRVEAVRRDFVANVSHELKTPVGALTLLAEAVQDAADDPEAIRRFAARMQHEGNRLGRLVGELIDLSRLQGGDPMPPLVEIKLAAIVAEATDRTRLAADAKGITLMVNGDEDLTVAAVEAQVFTAITNLMTNAVAYSQPGTKVAIGYRAREEYAEIAVTDEGIGIPAADLSRVFERFYRVDPARSSATGGTGLGLAIVKHVATNHGGAVDVWSVEGKGSTFTLRLPMHSADVQRDSGCLPEAAKLS